MLPGKPAVVRFYLDADVLGLAKVLVQVRADGAEIAAVRDSGARMVALAGPEAVGTWAQLEALCCQWRALERRLDEPVLSFTAPPERPFGRFRSISPVSGRADHDVKPAVYRRHSFPRASTHSYGSLNKWMRGASA
jgi:hypothetical protein